MNTCRLNRITWYLTTKVGATEVFYNNCLHYKVASCCVGHERWTVRKQGVETTIWHVADGFTTRTLVIHHTRHEDKGRSQLPASNNNNNNNIVKTHNAL